MLRQERDDGMSMGVEINPERGFLRVHLTGDFSLAEAKGTYLRTLEAVARHKVTKVLADCRDMRGTMTVMERFEYATFVAQEIAKASDMGVSRCTRFAYVSKPPFFDRKKFSETVAVNRGATVLTTDSMEEAVRWLEIDTDGKAADREAG
jgi:hypothetical protein